MFKVVEKFVSINGEGVLAGQLAVFIRFAGCNLNCSFCDTKWAKEPDVAYQLESSQQIYDYIKSTGIKNVTLTGGEPLLQEDMEELICLLNRDKTLAFEFETNGSVNLKKYVDLREQTGGQFTFTMDYKLPFSKMEQNMKLENFKLLKENDTVKFVVADTNDLNTAWNIVKKYELIDKVHIYLSPVFGEIEPVEIVNYMIEHRWNAVNMQIQMHKVIWDPEKRGV